MKTQEIIESGHLELYVYGLLDENETKNISELSKNNLLLTNEIVSIEKAIISLSSGFSPFLSNHNYEKIKEKLNFGKPKVIQLRTNWYQHLGWVASIALLLVFIYQFNSLNDKNQQLNNIEIEKANLQKSVVELEIENIENAKILTFITNENNTLVKLEGQPVNPQSFAKVYWNKESSMVYVDASGLPEPPKGKVYQVWSIKLSPTLTPKSIGLLNDFMDNKTKLYALDQTNDAEAFGITLEPEGGSQSPTMEQLYTLGKV